MLNIAGVEVSASAASQLAFLLHEHGEQGLAFHLGHAIDHLHDYFPLSRRERTAVLRVLSVCPSELADLRASLLADQLAHTKGREAQA